MDVALTKVIIRRYAELYNNGELPVADDLLAADYVDHTHPHFGPGPDGVKFMVSTVRAGFPDAHLNVERVVGEDSMTAFHWTLSGTHQASFAGFPDIAPTGKRFNVQGMTFFRIVSGKIVEGWMVQDDLGVLRQLGILGTDGRDEAR